MLPVTARYSIQFCRLSCADQIFSPHRGWAAVALIFTALSYLCLSAGFAAASRIFDARLNSRDLLAIGF